MLSTGLNKLNERQARRAGPAAAPAESGALELRSPTTTAAAPSAMLALPPVPPSPRAFARLYPASSAMIDLSVGSSSSGGAGRPAGLITLPDGRPPSRSPSADARPLSAQRRQASEILRVGSARRLAGRSPRAGGAAGAAEGEEGGAGSSEGDDEHDAGGRTVIKGYAAGNVEGRDRFSKTTVQAPMSEDGAVSGRNPLIPSVAPGGLLDLALHAKVRKSKRMGLHRPHKPDALKLLQQGKEEFERRKAAKAMGKIINKEHTFYHLSYGMMLGIYTSVVHSSNSTGWVGGGMLGAARPPTAGPGTARVPDARGSRDRSPSTIARSSTLAAAALAATEALDASAADGTRIAVPKKLELVDFMAVRKLEFPPEGCSLTPPHALPRTFKFKDYAPSVFHSLRQRFAIDPQYYLRSLGGAYEYIEFASNSKSGSFFFYSHDGRFMIKTQSKGESKFLRRILAHYHAYVMANPYTYITRFYGMHRIKMPHIRRKIHFVVMQSVFYGENDIHEMYDLKGSSVGRSATKAERAAGPSGCVYKDNDLLEFGTRLRLGPGRKDAFVGQLAKDAAFLESLGIMDYSLLLGVHHPSAASTAARHVLLGTGGPTVAPVPVGAALLELPPAGVGALAPSSGALPPVMLSNPAAAAPCSPLPVGGSGAGAQPPPVVAMMQAAAADAAQEDDDASSADGSDGTFVQHGDEDAGASGSDGEPGAVVGGRGSGRTGRRQNPRTPRAWTSEELLGLTLNSDGTIAPPAPTEAAGGGISGMTAGGVPSDDIYYVGIIDILQQYDMRKMGETLLKSVVLPVGGISAVAPSRYARRFIDFVKALVE